MSLPTQEQIDSLVAEVHPLMKEKGFYDPPPSAKALLMLIVAEFAEVIQADRHAKRYACPCDPKNFLVKFKGQEMKEEWLFENAYKLWIDGTVEGELSNACLRIIDYVGYNGCPLKVICVNLYEPDLPANLYDAAFRLMNGGISESLSILFAITKRFDIDLMTYIRLALEYCRLRERKHGKKY